MRKALEIGGFVAALVLIAFGIGAIVIGASGRDTVTESLEQERITGTPDMTPSEIAKAAKSAGLTNADLPSCTVAGKPVNSGERARCFAQYMRVHALEASKGFTYSQMGRFEAKPGAPKSELAEGGGTDNEEFAVKDPKTGEPVANGVREVWVTETALSTALNTSYMADRTALFGIVVGIALLLTGIGFAILVASGAIRDPESVFRRRSRPESAPPSA
jgi:F0F1-type ATP synthase membrane subunit c/vacuolar-type H+-ATPase subunit K